MRRPPAVIHAWVCVSVSEHCVVVLWYVNNVCDVRESVLSLLKA